MEIDRNTIDGFGRRVRKNLAFMIAARDQGEDIHIVTELMNALLGLLIFPYEHYRDNGSLGFKEHQLKDLEAADWPVWSFHIGCSTDLDDLLWHLRNALSHRRVKFSSDDRDLEHVDVTFFDRPNSLANDNWSATINAAALLKFVQCFSELMDHDV